jgi:hypothetical protein
MTRAAIDAVRATAYPIPTDGRRRSLLRPQDKECSPSADRTADPACSEPRSELLSPRARPPAPADPASVHPLGTT